MKLVEINNRYVNVYKSNYNHKFVLTSHMEPDLCYLAINDDFKYIYVYGDEQYTFNFPQTKIRREINKLKSL